MDLVSAVYKYVNRFINSDELIEELSKIDRKDFNVDENKNLDELIENIKNIVLTVPNEVDDIELSRIKSFENISNIFEKVINNENNDKETKKVIEEQYNKMKKDHARVRDSGERYEKVFECLVNNSLHKNLCKKMTNENLLNLITQYISVPNPPKIEQDTFDELVSIAIKDDKREDLWRLAFNYENRNKDFSKIEDYFIEVKDTYYLFELISAVTNDLDIDNIIKKVIGTNDKEFISSCADKAIHFGIITKEDALKIKEDNNL